MLYIGIDPGKHGAIGAVGAGGRVLFVQPTPIVTAGARARPEYDLPGVLATLRELVRLAGGAPSFTLTTLERLQPLPPKLPGGSIAQFSRGVARGWEWMLTALQMPYVAVPAPTWRRAMLLGTPGGDVKQRSILAAQRLFPQTCLLRTPRSRTLDDGLAEALLLAEYGRRTGA